MITLTDKGKIVTLISSMHHNTRVEGEQQKPHIILHYNSCKGGVDVMDKLATTYSCRRKFNRWPVTLFCNMVDVAGIAAMVVWMMEHAEENGPKKNLR